jgi:hypothetical protein
MADNFDMKKFLVENKLGAYSKLKNEGEAAYEYEKGKAAGEKLAKEDLGKDLEDTEAAKQMDFLAEYEVIYVERNGTCYRKDDEGNMDEVSMSYCRRYSEGKKEMDESNLNEDASQVVMDLLGTLAGVAGIALSGVQILKWQNKLEKENPELHKQLGKVSNTISGADPSKNLEENEEAKKKIKEALTPEMFERMDALTSTRAQIAMIKAAEIMMNELTKEGFEVLDIREYFTQLIANDI